MTKRRRRHIGSRWASLGLAVLALGLGCSHYIYFRHELDLLRRRIDRACALRASVQTDDQVRAFDELARVADDAEELSSFVPGRTALAHRREGLAADAKRMLEDGPAAAADLVARTRQSAWAPVGGEHRITATHISEAGARAFLDALIAASEAGRRLRRQLRRASAERHGLVLSDAAWSRLDTEITVAEADADKVGDAYRSASAARLRTSALVDRARRQAALAERADASARSLAVAVHRLQWAVLAYGNGRVALAHPLDPPLQWQRDLIAACLSDERASLAEQESKAHDALATAIQRLAEARAAERADRLAGAAQRRAQMWAERAQSQVQRVAEMGDVCTISDARRAVRRLRTASHYVDRASSALRHPAGVSSEAEQEAVASRLTSDLGALGSLYERVTTALRGAESAIEQALAAQATQSAETSSDNRSIFEQIWDGIKAIGRWLWDGAKWVWKKLTGS